MAKYKERRNENSVLVAYIRTVDDVYIQIAESNNGYQDVLRWIAEGNTPDPDDTLADRITQAQARDALSVKKQADITALGNRAAMQAEAASANSVPALRDLVLKLAEIVYSNEKGTID